MGDKNFTSIHNYLKWHVARKDISSPPRVGVSNTTSDTYLRIQNSTYKEAEMKLKTLLVSIGLGAGLMYFLDPEHGNRRRALVRDRANSLVNRLDDSIDMTVEEMRNRTRGVLSELMAKLSDQGAPDWILEERVRTNLGRLSRQARGVEVRADGGHIHLSGPVLQQDRDAILKTASRTRGVYGVENDFQIFDNPQDISSLQGSP